MTSMQPARTSRRPHFALAGITLAILAGCASVGPDFQAPQTSSPDAWSAWSSADPALRTGVNITAEPTTHNPQWWTVFGDATLDALQARAAQASPDIQTAALRFAQSRAQRTTVAAQRGPSVNATAAATRQRQSEYSPSTRLVDAVAGDNRDDLVSLLSDPFTLYQAGFDASWEVDLWGRVRRSVESADGSVLSSQAMLANMQLSIQSELARNYFELRLAQEQLRLAQQDVALARESLDLIEARTRAGLIDEVDLVRQRAQLADLRARLPALSAQQAALTNQIGLLMGARPGELTAQLASPLTPVADAATPDLALGIPSELAHRRPDILAAEGKLRSATADIGVATADLYPRITLGASFGLESFEGGKFGEWGSRTWQIGPSLSLPIFDQGRRRSVVVLRKLAQQEAAVSYQQTVLKAWQEIDDALTRYGAERLRRAELQEKTRNATDAYQLAQARYKAGATDYLVQLDTERTALQARRDWTDSSYQLLIDRVAIYKSVAAGTEGVAAGVERGNPPDEKPL